MKPVGRVSKTAKGSKVLLDPIGKISKNEKAKVSSSFGILGRSSTEIQRFVYSIHFFRNM